MTDLHESLAARWRAGQRLRGPLLRMPNETLIELSGAVGMDFVVVDTEHGPGDQIPLGHHLMAADGAGVPALVRVGALGEVLRVLDQGAAGIVVPHVSDADQARAAVRAAHYPPRGDRGFATYTRRGRHGLAGAAEHLTGSADTLVVAMIEDAAGVAAAAEIAAVDGIDGLFVGPADLSVALGLPGAVTHPEVTSAIAAVHQAARAAGKAVVAITGTADGARALYDGGADVVIFNALAALGTLWTDLAAAGAAADPGSDTGNDTRASGPAADPRVPLTDPVVLLPGMLGGPGTWDAVAPLLGVPCIQGRIDLDDSVAGMAESVLAAAPPRFSLAGHSLGGVVALEVARRAPDRVRALVLVNASGRAATDDQRAAWRGLLDRLDGGDFDGVVDDLVRDNLGPAAGDPDLVRRCVEGARRVGPAGLRRQLAAQATRPDSLPLLPGMALPVLVVGGADDDVCPPDRQRELADGIPGARLVVLPGAGHHLPGQAPDELAAAIRDLLGVGAPPVSRAAPTGGR
ncbi:aldolase/citrate lyase family protein [Nakamurella endophytica]|uniref:Alpha/beta fold hydrolase n=1 Tax=Nakamurella endophytica TaxID=1748367 RepID=A0A917SZH6_9ACTN|nr:aldolase/citrate lyase family protein [Nakamurella endophytica]GGM04979.1 hypothetical protein GCM10011594_26500 [Nakamurella endophytica]